jgi:flagellin-like protein
MEILSKAARGWRKKRNRAVSPIIATILLVAITVVLAAVLYILIQNYTKGSGTAAPLGSDVAFGKIVNATTATTVYLYNIPITSVNNPVALSSLQFQVKSPTGASVKIGEVCVSNVGGQIVGTWGGSSPGWGSAGGGGCDTTAVAPAGTASLASGYALSFAIGTPATVPAGTTFSLIATAGSYTGSAAQTL